MQEGNKTPLKNPEKYPRLGEAYQKTGKKHLDRWKGQKKRGWLE